MNKFKGGCMCEAVQYALTSEPRLSFLCQCRQCQRITGTGHSAEFVALTQDAIISGELTFYELISDSGNTVSSGFCPICGNPVLKKSSGYPGMLFFHAATLDNPAAAILILPPGYPVLGAGGGHDQPASMKSIKWSQLSKHK